MLVPSLLVLLLPVVAAVTLTTLVTSATLAISAIPVHHASAPAAVAVSPAIVLENQFRKIRNTQKLKSIPAPGSGDGDVQALGDLIKDPGDPNVTTRNELFEGHCSPIVVIFARGTTEPGTLCPLPSLSCCNDNFSFFLLQWQLTTGWQETLETAWAQRSSASCLSCVRPPSRASTTILPTSVSLPLPFSPFLPHLAG